MWRTFSAQLSFQDKYDAKSKAVIAVSRYQMGTPMYRLAKFQNYMRVPLPEGTQRQLILDVYQIAKLIFEAMIEVAAQADFFFIDDTWVKILDIIRHNKHQILKKNNKGTHASGILAMQGDQKIFLYFSGTQNSKPVLNELKTYMRSQFDSRAVEPNDITLMSIIRTASEAGANPVEYLTAFLENKDQIVKEPENWFPALINSKHFD